MKIKIRKVQFQGSTRTPYFEINAEDKNRNWSDTILRMEYSNEMNRKLAEKLKKCLEENIKLINI